jgi:pimeloyl-ACP methyl ester carboxylesterase
MRALVIGVLLVVLGCSSRPSADPASLPGWGAAAHTADGWTLSLFHVPPAGADAGGQPVVLVHGTAVNRFSWMYDEASLASVLSSRGFDVWIPELRGARSSTPPSTATWDAGAWTVDDLAAQDVPAILDAVLQATGRSQVLWVGHSMGGVLGYIAAQGPRAAQVAGLVTLGSPGSFRAPNDLALRLGKLRSAGTGKRLPARGLAGFFSPQLRVDIEAPLLHAIFNARNMDPAVVDALPGLLFEDIGRGVIRQYLQWITTGRLVSADGRRDWGAGLKDVRIPALVVAGRDDHIVPAWTVWDGWDQLGSVDKTWWALGPAEGCMEDYGHGDLILGSRVETEVFPRVTDWLLEHRPP